MQGDGRGRLLAGAVQLAVGEEVEPVVAGGERRRAGERDRVFVGGGVALAFDGVSDAGR